MHILFIGFGETSKATAKKLFDLGHQITSVSRTPSSNGLSTHFVQNVKSLDLKNIDTIDAIYILLSPSSNTNESYVETYIDSIPAVDAIVKKNKVKKIILVSSTRVYGGNEGNYIDDETKPNPNDSKGEVLLNMEKIWIKKHPDKVIVVRPTGIYKPTSARMENLAKTTISFPNVHWSNRIHIEDLSNFLVFLLNIEKPEKSYIVTNNNPKPMHEILQKIQIEKNLDILELMSIKESGKKIFATRLAGLNFSIIHKEIY